jgi:ribosomal protein S18 acetylase RimI-like enzyme
MSPAIEYRNMRLSDISGIQALEAVSFPGIPPDKYWQDAMLEAHIKVFPEGQFVAEIEGWIVASATSLLVDIHDALRPHTWREITGGGYLTTHKPDGNTLYLTEIMVHPDARRAGVAKKLYRLRQGLAREMGLRALVTGGRIPGYDKVADKLTAVEYVKSVLAGERADRTLSPQLSSGLTVAGVLDNYITDPKSRNHATLLVWWNLDWTPRGGR